MAQTIQIKRGSSANLGDLALAAGELAVALDTGKVYVGTSSGNVCINEGGSVDVGDVEGLMQSGKIKEELLPAIAITDVFEVPNESAMLALIAEKGDIAVRSDINKSFILKDAPAAELANWIELRTPENPVLSVNGKTGAVSIDISDLVDENSAFNQEFESNPANIKMNGNASAGISQNVARADHVHPTDTTLAPLDSPSLQGEPTSTTPALNDSTVRIATTAYVQGQGYIKQDQAIDGGTF